MGHHEAGVRRSKEEVKNFVITDPGPNIVDEATTRTYAQAFSAQQKLLTVLVIACIALIGTVVAAIIRLYFL